MAEGMEDNEDRTEEATPERREEFREQGNVALSREITSVFVLAACVIFLSYYLPTMFDKCRRLLRDHIGNAASVQLNPDDFHAYITQSWQECLLLILPIFAVTFTMAAAGTMLQTRFNWSWKKVTPDFTRLNPLRGLVQMFNLHAIGNLLKGSAKMLAVALVAYFILKDEWAKIPSLMRVPVNQAWAYWAVITKSLFWAVAGCLLVIGLGDYFFTFLGLEKKLKMTKQEVKEDLKRREVDPYVKGRLKRMQRDIVMSKTMSATRKATVLVTNPTHFSVAIQYEFGMPAPLVVAKGRDFLALRMREVAKELDIPIIENKPLARTLYKVVEVNQYIPESLYKAVSEVIRFVFKLKGKKLPVRPQPAHT